jgi:predicted phosphodiesterase
MKNSTVPYRRHLAVILGFIAVATFSCTPQNPKSKSLNESMDGILTRFYQDFSTEELKAATPEFVMANITPDEKDVMATKYWYFTANIPVVVSVMRHVDQKGVPFWLEESEFVKSDLTVTNEAYSYEVWRKEYPAGKVELGIPGFDNHRVPYFVSVGKANKSSKEELKLTETFPANQEIQPMQKGSHVYTCWQLEVQEFPKELEGDILLSSNRGRPRESHLVNALRETLFPSSEKPDQIALTWSDDTQTSMDIQWRTALAVTKSTLSYWAEGSTDTLTVDSKVKELYDRLVYNDPRVNRHSVQLKGLKPGTTYQYQVTAGSEKSAVYNFTTAADDDKFTFIWTGDSHHSEIWGSLVQKAEKKHPEAAFISIAGDIVTNGLYRNQWDDIFGYTGDLLSRKPLMPVPGNHDNQDALGNQLYYDLMSYPMNAPEGIDPESTYSFVYKNALYLMIDATQSVEITAAWIEEQLKNSDATWKFAMFHFAPYNWEAPYYDIQEQWIPLFDKYHVDLVMSGHLHYYMRSQPMNAGQVVKDFSKGTVYAISIGINSDPADPGHEPYAVVSENKSQYYQTVEINGKTLRYVSYNKDGDIVDSFEIKK